MLGAAVRLVTAGDRPALLAAAAVVIYAAMAGFRTISSHDLFWQLRDARYLVETGDIARSDVFSYTATGQPWMYPQGAGLIFYGLYWLGGFVAVSLLGLVTCAATTTVLLALRPGVLAAALVGLAVPQIAMRTVAWAEMFTILFFALFPRPVVPWGGREAPVAVAPAHGDLGQFTPRLSRRLRINSVVSGGGMVDWGPGAKARIHRRPVPFSHFPEPVWSRGLADSFATGAGTLAVSKDGHSLVAFVLELVAA